MARLPDVSTQGERPTPRPATGIVSYQADMGGGQAPGMALAQAGETLQQIGAQFQEKADTTRVEDAWNQYKNAALDLTVGENGLLKKQAGDAVNSNMLQTAGKTLGGTRAGIESMLANDNQRRRFAERANVTDLQTKQQIISHMATQQAAYDKQVMMGSEGAAKAQITAAPMSPDVFQQARDTLMAQADAFLTSNGVTDKKARTEYKDKVSDTLWATRIDALLYDKPLLADALFRANEKEIKNPEMKLQFQAKTREASMSVRASMEAQAAIDEVRKTMPPAAGRGPEQPFTPGSTEQIGISDDGTPRSLRNNNPGNIKKSSVQWQGELPGGDATFVSFATPEDGMRALQQNLITYQDKHGLNTPAAIISRWAPAKENGKESTDNYINHVAESIGVKPGDKIDLHDQATLQRVSVAIARFEAGGTGSREKQDPLAVNTSGLPTARDVGAQLPIIMGQVEKTATRLYGPDQTNPDRAAFVRRMSTEVQTKLNADVHQLNAIQRQAQGALIDAITGLSAPTPQDDGTMKVGGAPQARALITSFGQIQANPALMRAWQMMDPQAKLGIERLLEHNARDAAKGGKAGDEVLYRDLWNRVHLPPGDPRKIEFYGQITDPAIADRLSISQIGQIRLEIDRSETPGGRSLNQMRKNADSTARSWFATNKGLTTYGAYPEKAIEATNRWNDEVGKKVDAYVAAGQTEKIRLMFQLDTPESVIKPEYLQTFVNSTPAQGLAEGAAKAAAATTPIAQPANIDTREKLDAWFKTLPATVTSFTGADGKIRAIPGRAAQLTPTASTWTPNPTDVRADGSQKGVGFLGPLVRPDGKTSTEISMSTDAVGGKDFPLLVPTLDKAEVDKILAIPVDDPKFFDKVPKTAVAKAEAFAETRVKEGKPLFAQPGEQGTPATAPAAAAAEDAEIPTLVEGPAGKVKLTDEERAANRARLASTIGELLRQGFQGALYVAATPLRMVRNTVVPIVEMVPSQEDMTVNRFHAMIQSGTFRANEATFVTLNNFLASKRGTPTENAKAQKMIKVISDKLGIEPTPAGP